MKDVLCSNFVKYGRRETGKIVRCLPEKKQNFAWLFRYRYWADRAQNLPGPAADNVDSDCSRCHPHRFTFGELYPNAWTLSKCFQYSAEA